MPGPAPMPTRMKLLTGNRGKRSLNDQEPEPENKIPVKPRILQGIARHEWYRITKILHKLELLTEIDMAALAAYCQSYQRWCEAEKNLRKDGLIVITEKGFPVQSPYVGISNKALENMKKFLTEFGMTPASRSRVKVPQKKQKATGFSDI